MMRMIGKKICGCLAAILAAGILTLALSPTALADTDESTLRMAKEPDQLVLQLGVRWAGVEFQLRTDAGLFPVPVVVNESGVLTMDLGGSTTYTLTCMDSTVPIPDPEQSQTAAESETPQMTAQPEPTQPALDPPVQQQAPMWPAWRLREAHSSPFKSQNAVSRITTSGKMTRRNSPNTHQHTDPKASILGLNSSILVLKKKV